MARNYLQIPKDVYLWAIDESDRDFEDIKFRYENIDKWIDGEVEPTFRQVQDLANYLRVPFGYMFLDEPPVINIIESDFRTIGNKVPNISKNLKDTLYNIGRKRDIISEYRLDQGWDKLLTDDIIDIKTQNIHTIAKIAKDIIDLDEYWYENKSGDNGFNFLREKLEDFGIIVMQNSVVGQNNTRKLDLNEFRGFLLNDDVAPIIFINSNDSINGKIFTLVHEYIHFLLGEEDILINSDFEDNNEERTINKITAEFLMPRTHIYEMWYENLDYEEQIKDMSQLFNVSIYALAIRLKNLGFIGQELVNSAKKWTNENIKNRPQGSGGGHYYNTMRSRLGDNFIKTVIEGTESGNISYTDAFRLLDNSSKLYDYFKEEGVHYEG